MLRVKCVECPADSDHEVVAVYDTWADAWRDAFDRDVAELKTDSGPGMWMVLETTDGKFAVFTP